MSVQDTERGIANRGTSPDKEKLSAQLASVVNLDEILIRKCREFPEIEKGIFNRRLYNAARSEVLDYGTQLLKYGVVYMNSGVRSFSKTECLAKLAVGLYEFITNTDPSDPDFNNLVIRFLELLIDIRTELAERILKDEDGQNSFGKENEGYPYHGILSAYPFHQSSDWSARLERLRSVRSRKVARKISPKEQKKQGRLVATVEGMTKEDFLGKLDDQYQKKKVGTLYPGKLNINNALETLKLITTKDIVAVTGDTLPGKDGLTLGGYDMPVIGHIPYIFYSGPYTTLLDPKGRPDFINAFAAKSDSPILAAPGLFHNTIPGQPGIYLSLSPALTIRISEKGIEKTAMKGVASFRDFNNNPYKPFTDALQPKDKNQFPCAIVTGASFLPVYRNPDEIAERTLQLVYRVAELMIVDAYNALRKEEEKIRQYGWEEVIRLYNRIYLEVFREVIEMIAFRIFTFIIKKYFAKLIPLLNVVDMVIALRDKEMQQNVRVCFMSILMAIKGNDEELEIAANVMKDPVIDLLKIAMQEIMGRIKQKLANFNFAAPKKTQVVQGQMPGKPDPFPQTTGTHPPSTLESKGDDATKGVLQHYDPFTSLPKKGIENKGLPQTHPEELPGDSRINQRALESEPEIPRDKKPGGQNPEQVDEATNTEVERAFQEWHNPSGEIETTFETTKNLAKGNLGERMAAESLATDGHTILLYKPDIRGTNQGGIDLLTLKDGKVYFFDNKAYSAPKNIGEVTALRRNFTKNRSTVLAQLELMRNQAHRSPEEIATISQAIDAINSGNFEKVVTNAALVDTDVVPRDISGKLKREGILFIDLMR